MRLSPLGRVLAAAALAFLIASCTSSAATPGWTYFPPPPTTAAPVTSAAPSSGGSAAPASGAASPAASGGGAGAALQVTASGVKFNVTTLQAAANQPFTIAFDNQDSGIPHNIQILDPSGKVVFDGETVTGPGKVTYSVPALPGGSYKFQCKYHANAMLGTLTVG